MRLWIGGLAVLAAGVLVACGSGGSAPAPPLPTPSPAPTVAPVAVPAVGSSTSVALDTTQFTGSGGTGALVPVPLPTDPSGVGGSLGVASGSNVPSGTTVDEGLVASPQDVPALAFARSPQAVRAPRATRQALLFVSLRFSKDVTLAQGPQIQITFPLALPTAERYLVAFYDPLRPSLGWQYGYEGPSTPAVSGIGSVLVFGPNPLPITFAAYTRYYFAVYGQSLDAPLPTPAPVGVPTIPPSPTPAPVVAPTALAFGGLGAAAAQTVTLTEAGYTGRFTLAGADCAGIVSVGGTSPTFTVTPLAAGTCRLVASGDRGASSIVAVGVAVSSLGLTIPSASPTAAPTTAPFALPTGVALTLGNSGTTFAVNALGTTQPPVFATVVDPTVAQVSPSVWTSPLPATFTVIGLLPGQTQILVSGNQTQVQSIPVVVGAQGSQITIPAFPSPSPTPAGSIVIVSPAPLPASLPTFGPSLQVTVNGSTSAVAPPIYAVSLNTSAARVSPTVWTSPLPATFTVTPLNAGFATIEFTDPAGRRTYYGVQVK